MPENPAQDSPSSNVEGRIAVALLASWIAMAAIPGGLGRPTIPESQLPLIVALGIGTILALTGLVASFLRQDSTAIRLGQIGLLASRFGLGIAAVGAVTFLVFPFNLETSQTVLGLSLLGLLGLAFAFTGGLGGFPNFTVGSSSTRGRRGTETALQPVVLIATILLIAVVGFWGFKQLLDPPRPEPFGTVVLLVAGFVAVSLLLYLGSVAFHILGLSNRSEALGLPEGSIRALIAMSLILMFAIIGIAVFQAGQFTEEFTSKGVTEEQLSGFAQAEIVSIVRVEGADADTFDVTIRKAMPDASHDFGLQLLTTVSTLVVAVSGFYFGARSVTAAAAAVGHEDGRGSVTIVSPKSETSLSKANNKWEPVEIVVTASPPYVDLQPEVKGDADGQVQRAGRGKFTYTPDDPGEVVVITFTMVDPYSGTERLIFNRPA